MNTKLKSSVVVLTNKEIATVAGGVEKEGLLPRKFGDQDFLVYVDGALIGTTYGTASGGTYGSAGLGGPLQGSLNGRPFP